MSNEHVVPRLKPLVNRYKRPRGSILEVSPHEDRTFQISIPPYTIPGTWMIAPKAHGSDRWHSAVERIWIPEQPHHVESFVKFSLQSNSVAPAIRRTSRKLRLLNMLKPPPAMELGQQIFFDTRSDDYFNWSHQVNFYNTLALAARKWLNEDLIIVLAAGMPKIVFDVYELFGFKAVATDGVVSGRQCLWDVPHWETVSSGRKILVPDDYDLPKFNTPRKVYISRRGFRAISNEAEVEAALPDYTKIYTEDLSAAEQFALFRNATHIVAIHGAGLAPMQYRPRSEPPLRLVEIAPVGMLTRWFAIMCDQIGGRYIQVRGRIKPEYVRHLYLDKPFVEFTNDSFEVDPESLRVATEMIN